MNRWRRFWRGPCGRGSSCRGCARVDSLAGLRLNRGRFMKSPLWLLLIAGSASADIDAPPPLRPLPVFESAGVGCGIRGSGDFVRQRAAGADVAGPAHRVREEVPTDGYMAHFTIDSDYGDIQVHRHRARPASRIHEMEAIRQTGGSEQERPVRGRRETLDRTTGRRR